MIKCHSLEKLSLKWKLKQEHGTAVPFYSGSGSTSASGGINEQYKEKLIDAIIQNCDTLKVLSLTECHGFRFEDIEYICTKCVNLKELGIGGTISPEVYGDIERSSIHSFTRCLIKDYAFS